MRTIGPSVVGFSGAFHPGGGGTGTGQSFQRLSFEAHGLIWAFYSAGTRIVYKTSPIGENWPGDPGIPVTVDQYANKPGNDFSLFFDGVHLHTVHDYSNIAIQYRRGLLKADGSISWDPVQNVVTGIRGFCSGICVDDPYGYPYIVYNEWDGDGRIYLIKSQTKDGRWVTAPGFPIEITSEAEVALHAGDHAPYPAAYWNVCVVPLTGGKLYVAYTYEFAQVWGKVFDGTQFLTDELAMPRHLSDDGVWSMAASGDIVHLAAHADGIWTTTRAGSWSQPVYLGATERPQDSPVVSIGPDGNPYVFWQKGDGDASMWYAYLQGGIWTPVHWYSGDFSAGWTLSGYYKMQGNRLGILHIIHFAYPRYVEYAALAQDGVITHDLTIAKDGSGTTNPSLGTHSYLDGETVEITALPAAGWEFSHWEEGGVIIGDVPTISIDMYASHTIIAVFTGTTPTQYLLTIAAGFGGTTDPEPGDYPYDEDTSVPVTAIPEAGYMFVKWEETGSTVKTINVIMDSDKTRTAVFKEVVLPPNEYSVSLSVIGGGTTTPPQGTYPVPEGDDFDISAKATSGWKFVRWQGDFSSTSPTATISVYSNMSITAVFEEAAQPPVVLAGVAVVGALIATVAATIFLIFRRKK